MSIGELIIIILLLVIIFLLFTIATKLTSCEVDKIQVINELRQNRKPLEVIAERIETSIYKTHKTSVSTERAQINEEESL